MTYVVKIKENTKSKPLIDHLKTLDYVTIVQDEGVFSPAEFRKMIRASEKSRSIPFEEAKRMSEKWKLKKK